MDSFIFKGKSSKDFKIIINSLPTISKPPLRVEEIEIDGVDGARYEELGYGCYEKKIKITITEDNIDSLINWLKGEGDLILSNEPDKYYNAKIIEQIDFERLMKYEPTEIKFRVQPFKYQYQEEKLIAKTGSVEGTEIKISDVKAVQLQIDGRSMQDGIPTPDTPVEIESVGYTNLLTGKFRKGNFAGAVNDIRLFCDDNYYIEKGRTYTFSTNAVEKGLEYGVNTASVKFPIPNIDYINFDTGWQTKETITFTATTNGYLGIPISKVNKTETISLDDLNDVWFTLTETSEYVPEGKYVVVLKMTNETDINALSIILNEPLRSLPNGVKDILYIKNNKLYVDRYVDSVVFNGSEDWIYENSVTSPTERTVVRKYFVSTNNNAWLSNRFIMDTEETPFDGNILTICSDVIYLSTKDEITGILSTDDNATRVSKIKTYLSTHNTEVIYELATPVTEEYGDITILDLLDGENNISNSADTNMVIDYIETLTINNLGNYISKPILEIEGMGTINLILNDSNVFSYSFDNDDKVVIDSEKEDAYLGLTLKNRNMNGDFPIFNPGENKITWDGIIKNINVVKKSRWL